MANADAPFGARPISDSGGHYSGVLNRYYCNVADAIYIGDIVAIEGAEDADGVPSVIACTPSLIPAGIVVGIEPSADIPETQLYKKSGDTVYLLVDDNPNVRFEIQCGAGTLAAGNIGLNGDLVFTEGSTVTGRSKMELDHSTLTLSAALHMSLERVVQSPDNELAENAVVECTFNQHNKLGGDVGV